jgi:hypothetical protein
VLRRAVSWKYNEVSEVLTVSIIGAELQYLTLQFFFTKVENNNMVTGVNGFGLMTYLIGET